jgi:hypothetical protein
MKFSEFIKQDLNEAKTKVIDDKFLNPGGKTKWFVSAFYEESGPTRSFEFNASDDLNFKEYVDMANKKLLKVPAGGVTKSKKYGNTTVVINEEEDWRSGTCWYVFGKNETDVKDMIKKIEKDIDSFVFWR